VAIAKAQSERDARLLSQYAAEIRTLKGQTAELLIRIGQRLMEAKKIAKRAQWVSFLIEADVSLPTARRFMRLAEAFGEEVPNLPIGRLDAIVKTLARSEDRKTFLSSENLDTLSPQEFTERLASFKSQADNYKSRAECAERKYSAIVHTLQDAPAKVIEANMSVRRVHAALAQSIESLRSIDHHLIVNDIDHGTVRSAKELIQSWVDILEQRQEA
jgi:transcriptional regulator with XRE-family HTH domain